MIYPKVLISSSRYDFACDYIVSKLYVLEIDYLRLNKEDFNEYSLHLEPE